MIYSTDWSVSLYSAQHHPHPHLLKALSLPSPSGFTPGSSLALAFLMVTAQAVKVWLPFSLHEENRFPGVWECTTVDPISMQLSLVVEGPWPLAIFPAFVWPGAGQSSWLGAHHLPDEPIVAGIQDEDPHRSNLASSLSCAQAGSFLSTLTGVSGPAAKDITQTQLWSPQSLLKRKEFSAESIKCHMTP